MPTIAPPDPGLLTGSDWRQACAIVGAMLDAADDDEQFARCGIEQLPRLVGSELTTLSLCDLQSGRRHVIASPAAAIDDDARAAFDRHFRMHPLVRHHAFERGDHAHRVSDSITFADFRRTDLYDQYYRRVGIRHVMALPVMVDDAWLVSFVLNRGGHDFTDRDRARVDVLRQSIARLFRRTRLLDRVRDGAARLAPALPRLRELSTREHEVLTWVAAGKTDRDIGEILGISHRTVHKHLQRVYAKLGVETRTAAVMRVIK